MSLRRLSIAMVLVCGLCVWGFARSGDEPASAHGAEPGIEADDECNNHDEAAARYRTNQSRHWRQLAVGSSCNH